MELANSYLQWAKPGAYLQTLRTTAQQQASFVASRQHISYISVIS